MNIKDAKEIIDVSKVFCEYGRDFFFRDANGQVISEKEAILIIKLAFIDLLLKGDCNFAHQVKLSLERKLMIKILGVYFSTERDKYILVPSYGGIGITEKKYEFTSMISSKCEICPESKNDIR